MKDSAHRDAKSGSALADFVLIVVCLFGIGGFFAFESVHNDCHLRKLQPLATATALEQAANYFYTEYGKLPDVGERMTIDSPEGVKLLTVLLGLEGQSANKQNACDIKFLSVREGKNHKNGLIHHATGTSVEGLYDPWGNPYTVVLDTDYDEKLHFSVGSRTVDLQGRRSAAFSPGADGKLGTADDVKTW
ncbi:MAG: hypothetical protein ABIS50_17420 [Luteolibacter sp.]|uniref:hypothetical protein n=1 Tax=Luteolibacter sp. TaxID=1962973 RepID=UPI003265C322